MFRAVVLLIGLLLAMPATATQFERLDINAELSDGSAAVSIETTATVDDRLVLALPARPSAVTVTPETNWTVSQSTDGWELTVIGNGTFDIIADYSGNNLAVNVGNGEWLFSYSFRPDLLVKEFTLRVALPEEAVVVERGGLLVSRPVDISTDGRRIFLVWRQALLQGEEFSAFVQYSVDQRATIELLPVLVILVLIIGLAVGYRFRRFKKEKFVEQIIGPDEKQVVSKIKEKGGELLQEELVSSLDWSKTKVSKVVRNLEAKGIIEKIPHRKTNRLRLK